MRRILTSTVLLVLLFPALALGGEIRIEDLLYRDGFYYKKFSDVPFTGKTTEKIQGSFKDGKKHGPWVYYWGNGQLSSRGTYKDGKKHGTWVYYKEDGTVKDKYIGTFKDEVKPD